MRSYMIWAKVILFKEICYVEDSIEVVHIADVSGSAALKPNIQLP